MPKNKLPSISKVQIRMGTQHELEHTSSRKVARRIAMDHLKEHPQYYTFLNKAERQMSLAEKKKR